MSDFGNESTSAVLRFGEKGLELLMKLVHYLMNNHKDKFEKEIRKEQLKRLQNENQRDEAAKYLNEHRGYVKMKYLEKSGEKLMPIAVELSKEQLKQFNSYAKMEGVVYSAISNKKILGEIRDIEKQLKELSKKETLTESEQKLSNELNDRLQALNRQRENRIIIIRAKDLDLVADITDRMNRDIALENINKEMEAYETAGLDNLSPEQLKKYQDLKGQRNDIFEKEFDAFNKKNNDAILAGNAENPAWEEMNFDRALSRVTDRKYAQESCYVCDRSNPENYMEVSSQQQISDEGKPFTNTEYKVFNQGVEQKSQEFSHGKFTHYTDSKGESTSSYGQKHWENMKKEIKEKGGFSDDVIIFSNKEDYMAYKTQFREMKEKTSLREDTIGVEADANSYKDYAGMVNQLKSQLQEHGFMMNAQKELCNSSTGNPVKITPQMTDDEKMECAEAINMCKQINTYEDLNNLQNQHAFVQQQQAINENNFSNQNQSEAAKAMYEQMKDNLDKQEQEIQEKESKLTEQANSLQIEREKIASARIVEEIQESHDDVISNDVEEDRKDERSPHREERITQGKDDWGKQIKDNPVPAMQNGAAEKIDINVMEK